MGGAAIPGSASLEVVVPGSKALVENPLHDFSVLVWPTVLGESTPCVHTAPLSERETATFPELFPGFWFVEVVGRVRPAVNAGVLTQREVVELRPGGSRSLVLPPRFAFIKGRIHHRGEPAHCLVELRVEDAEGREHKTAGWSRPNGAFVLPGMPPGRGEAVVTCLKPQARTTIGPLDVQPPSPLELEIPGGAITGVVVDRKGLPLSGWRVEARYLDPEVRESVAFVRYTFSQETDARGKFQFAYLTPGRYRVVAFSPAGWQSRPIVTEVGPGTEPQKLTLQVEETKKALRLHLPGLGGTFSLLGVPRQGEPSSINDFGAWGEIPADGVLHLPFPLEAVAEAFLTVVLPPPRGVWCGAIDPQWWRASDTVELTIPDLWGSLDIRYRPKGDRYPPLWLVAGNGGVCGLLELTQEANPPAAVWDQKNGRIFIPALAPGLYQVLATPDGTLSLQSLAGRGRPGAPWVSVTPGALATVEASLSP